MYSLENAGYIFELRSRFHNSTNPVNMFLSSKPRDADCFILVSTETLLSASGRIFCINSESVSTVFPYRYLLNLNSKNKRINSKLGPPYCSKVPESPRPPSICLSIDFFLSGSCYFFHWCSPFFLVSLHTPPPTFLSW